MLDAVRPLSIGLHETLILEPPEPNAARLAADRALLCRDLLDEAVMALIREQLVGAEFARTTHGTLGWREAEVGRKVSRLFHFLLRRPPLSDWIEAVTGCGTLGDFEGSVVQTRAGTDQGFVWHNDVAGTRRVAITINLTDMPYEGALFEMRDAKSKEVLWDFQHDVPGTALIFPVTPAFEHRLLPVTSGGPRRVFAGWFHAPRVAT